MRVAASPLARSPRPLAEPAIRRSTSWAPRHLASCVVRDPQVADLAAAIQPATHHPGLHRFFQGATWLWAAIFLLLTAGLAVMMITGQNVPDALDRRYRRACRAGTGASTPWFLPVLRRLGLRLRFAPA